MLSLLAVSTPWLPGSEFFAAAVAGLASVPHCALMCGPLAVWACGTKPTCGVLPKALFLGARLLAYGCVGGLAAYLGTWFTRVSQGSYVSSAVASVVAALLIYSAFKVFRRGDKNASSFVSKSKLLRKGVRPGEAVGKNVFLFRPILAGVSTSMLPCGALIAGLLIAAAAPSPFEGTLRMMCFGVASSGGIIGFSWLFGKLKKAPSGRFSKILALTFLASAAVLIFSAFPETPEPETPEDEEEIPSVCPLHAAPSVSETATSHGSTRSLGRAEFPLLDAMEGGLSAREGED